MLLQLPPLLLPHHAGTLSAPIQIQTTTTLPPLVRPPRPLPRLGVIERWLSS